jgi:tRNA(Ser,Leu) C12 N-acetylase TAN1
VREWNVLVTVLPGRDPAVLSELRHRGEFNRSGFKGVLTGRVEDVPEFLQSLYQAVEHGSLWVRDIARILPLERTFSFTPETFVDLLKEAVSPFVQTMEGGTFFVRLERRGYKGKILSPDVERTVDAHILILAEKEGKSLRVSFEDPDYIIAVETVGPRCGVALISRELRTRYPFVKIR